MSDTQFDCFRALALDDNAAGMAAMLDAGFDVNTVNAARQTVLMHCCANDRQRAARFLVARGADLNVTDHGGTTAMDFALRHASRDFRDWLAGAGARTWDSGDYSHRQPGERRS
jgi:ankyrin repeat protein